MTKPKPKAKVEPVTAPNYTVSNCTFTNESASPLSDAECSAIEALADALTANANAAAALASGLRGGVYNSRAMLEVGK